MSCLLCFFVLRLIFSVSLSFLSLPFSLSLSLFFFSLSLSLYLFPFFLPCFVSFSCFFLIMMSCYIFVLGEGVVLVAFVTWNAQFQNIKFTKTFISWILSVLVSKGPLHLTLKSLNILVGLFFLCVFCLVCFCVCLIVFRIKNCSPPSKNRYFCLFLSVSLSFYFSSSLFSHFPFSFSRSISVYFTFSFVCLCCFCLAFCFMTRTIS